MKLIDLAQAIEDRKVIQISAEHIPPGMGAHVTGAKWIDTVGADHPLKYWMNNQYSVRIKPEPKVIDMSVLEQSGILCVFYEAPPEIKSHIGLLDVLIPPSSRPKRYYMNDGSGGRRPFQYCKPLVEYWYAWQGGDKCPLPDGLVVEVMIRANRDPMNAGCYRTLCGWQWDDLNRANDIIAFKVIGLADGWEWP